MIVRVDGSLGSKLSTEELDSSVRDDLQERIQTKERRSEKERPTSSSSK